MIATAQFLRAFRRRSVSRTFPSIRVRIVTFRSWRNLALFHPILQEGTRLGTIYLQADLGEMYSRFEVYGLLLLCVGVASSLGAIVLTTTLQQRISVPILSFARVAGSVSDLPDYSVRAVKHR